MTLHWWMHWFWITYQLGVCFCDVVTQPMQSLPSELHETTKIPTIIDRSVKAIGSTSYIPPITAASTNGNPNASAVIPIKLHKSSKKHELYANMTNKSSVNTEHPLVKETTVIDQNVTDAGLNIIDNQTLINTSFNAINRAENLSFVNDDGMNQTIFINSERVGAENQENTKGSLTAAGITGITLGCVSIIGVICAVSFIMYRNYGFNRPQVLNDRCSNPDSSGYIDDSTVRENSEEMYSLDNDSFLNSLEAMTIQNLWTDTVKHTKL